MFWRNLKTEKNARIFLLTNNYICILIFLRTTFVVREETILSEFALC